MTGPAIDRAASVSSAIIATTDPDDESRRRSSGCKVGLTVALEVPVATMASEMLVRLGKTWRVPANGSVWISSNTKAVLTAIVADFLGRVRRQSIFRQ